jgi:charged multivesicular body protein 7
VVSEAISHKTFLGLKEFEEAKESIYKSGWKIPTLGEVLGWGLKQLGLGLGFGGARISGKRVIVLGNLEEAGKAFEGRTKGQRSRVDRLWSIGAFKEEFRDVLGSGKELSNADFDVLLRYLQRDKGLVSWDGETVKLRAKGEADGITTEDTSIANLKTLIADLGVQTKVLESRVDELNITAKKAVEKKNRVAALSVLRNKKLAETTLTKRHATLSQLEEVFASIEQAADQVELVKVMEGSARVLKGLNEEVGGVDRVDDVVENLREEMGKVDEVGNVIAEVGQSAVDDGEVDDELEAMEEEERRRVEEVERKEREERESKEAEETKKRLDALSEESMARENATPETKKEVEKEIDESEKALKRVSLDPTENVPA